MCFFTQEYGRFLGSLFHNIIIYARVVLVFFDFVVYIWVFSLFFSNLGKSCLSFVCRFGRFVLDLAFLDFVHGLLLAIIGRKTTFCFYVFTFRGLCPHPQETEFLDFQSGTLGGFLAGKQGFSIRDCQCFDHRIDIAHDKCI